MSELFTPDAPSGPGKRLGFQHGSRRTRDVAVDYNAGSRIEGSRVPAGCRSASASVPSATEQHG